MRKAKQLEDTVFNLLVAIEDGDREGEDTLADQIEQLVLQSFLSLKDPSGMLCTEVRGCIDAAIERYQGKGER